MPDRHALTLRQPTADDVVTGRRWLLPRPRRHVYTGRLLIHAARYRPSHPSLGGDAVDAPELPLGAIVGSVDLAAWVPVITGHHDEDSAEYQRFWLTWQSGDPFVDVAGGLSRYWPAWAPLDPERGWVDATDQVGGTDPWVAVLTRPAATWDRCPICWADGEPCPVCDSAGTCPPIGDVRGSGGLWRYRAATGCRR